MLSASRYVRRRNEGPCLSRNHACRFQKSCCGFGTLFETVLLFIRYTTDHGPKFAVTFPRYFGHFLQKNLDSTHSVLHSLNNQTRCLGCKSFSLHIADTYPIQRFLDYLCFTHRYFMLEYGVQSTYLPPVRGVQYVVNTPF